MTDLKGLELNLVCGQAFFLAPLRVALVFEFPSFPEDTLGSLSVPKGVVGIECGGSQSSYRNICLGSFARF